MNTIGHSAPEEVMAFLDGELVVAEARLVAAHLEHCAECAALADQFRSTSQMLSRWDVEPVPLRLSDAVGSLATSNARDHKSTERKRSFLWRGRSLVMAGGGLAVVALLVSVSFLPVRRRAVSYTFQEPKLVSENNSLAPLLLEDKKKEYQAPALADKAKAKQFDRLDQFARMHEFMGASSHASASAAILSESKNGVLDSARFSVPAPMIARAVSLTLRVKDVSAARSPLDSILARHRGYSAQLNVSAPENGSRSFIASLRIPSTELSAAVGEIKALGRVENESQSGEEVSQQHADLVARLKTARETEERFQAILLQRTGKLSDVLEVEQNIARVRGEIEAMETEQKALEHRVDFASVEVQLTEDYKAQIGLPPDSVSTRMHNAFVTGYHNAAESVVGLVLFIEEFGPPLVLWLVILGLPMVVGWRRYKRARATL